MNWDAQLSSILSAADGSVAKMREHLTTSGKAYKDVFSRSDVSPIMHLGALPPSVSPLPLSSAVQWGDIAGIQAQLQSQSQAIESLTQALRSMERERASQHCLLQALQEGLRRLHERAEEQGKVGDQLPPGLGVESRMEQWKREVHRELSGLREHVDRATCRGSQEESFSSKLRREEVEELWREVEQLKEQLRRHKEEMLHQQAETREMRRHSERTFKTLENLTDNYKSHMLDLSRTMAEHQDIQRDLQQLRLTVMELKEEVGRLSRRDGRDPPAPTAHRPGRTASVSEDRTAFDSEEDCSPTPSLGDVSSDDLSWLEDIKTAPQRKNPSATFQLTECESSEIGSGAESPSGHGDCRDHSHEDELYVSSGSSAELSISDL